MVVQDFTFFLVCVVFCHLFRVAYFNYIKDINPLVTDSFKPSFVICKSGSI